MPGPIPDELQKAFKPAYSLDRLKRIHCTAHRFYDGEIRHFIISADVICLAGHTFAVDEKERVDMIFHVQPVPHVHAIAVYRNRSPVKAVQNR